MKTFKNASWRWLVSVGAVCLLSVLFSSCLKTNKNNYYPPVALVTFIQASPDEPPLDFYLNNNRININPINYQDHFNYFRAFAGTRTANFYNAGSMSKVFSDTVHLSQNTDYSLFLANKATQPEIVLLTDTINQPAAGMASVRFVNLSPDAPAVDLVVKGGSTLVSNKAYKGYSSFVSLPGNTTYTFQIMQAGTNTVLATLLDVPVYNGSVITIWFHGLAAATTAPDQLGASIYANAFF